MSISRIAPLSLLVVLAVPGVSSAQTCLGLPSFSEGSVNIRGTLESATGYTAFGGGIHLGGQSAFVGVSGDVTSYSGNTGSEKLFSADGGVQIPLGASKMASLCPVVEAGLTSGPDVTGYSNSGHDISGGLSLGVNLAAGTSFHVVPNAYGAVVNVSRTDTPTGASTGTTSSKTYEKLRLGLGLLFSGSFEITPFVSIPIDYDGLTTSYGVYVSLALGGHHK